MRLPFRPFAIGVIALTLGGLLVRVAPPLLATRAEAATAPTAPVLATDGTRSIHEPIQPLAPAVVTSPAKVALGAKLFVDKRLSSDGTISCADCHDLARGGADGRRLSIGVGGRLGAVNAPTVFNVDANVKQFWDGRAETLEQQVDGPVLSPDEMGATWPAVLQKLSADPTYVAMFAGSPGGVSVANVKDALAAFERTLVTDGSRFDAHLRGDQTALSGEEKQGYALFKSYGCISCHQGKNVGGNLFETLGVMGDYFGDRGGEITRADLGRFNVTGKAEDRFRFRVPSLRLVAQTAPYLHDGRLATLEEAIVVMGKYQLGVRIPPEHVVSIAHFLASLAGSVPAPDGRADR